MTAPSGVTLPMVLAPQLATMRSPFPSKTIPTGFRSPSVTKSRGAPSSTTLIELAAMFA